MSETMSLGLLGEQMHTMQADVRALQRQMAMLQAGLAEMPTRDQFQAGLGAIDKQFVELGTAIAETVTTAVGSRFDLLEQRLDQTERSVEARLARIEALLAPGR